MAICEKTGLTFDAKSTRVKNHPSIMTMLGKATKDGWYREAMQALEEYKGKLGSIEEYIELLDGTRQAKEAQASAKFRQEYAAKQAAKEAHREREALRQKLARAGYFWHNVGISDAEEADELGVEVGPSYALFAPDGAIVSVEQALAEIANPALVSERLEAERIESSRRYEEQQERLEAEQQAVEAAPVQAEQIAQPENPTPVDEVDLYLLGMLMPEHEKDEYPQIVPGSESDKKYQAAKVYWESKRRQP